MSSGVQQLLGATHSRAQAARYACLAHHAAALQPPPLPPRLLLLLLLQSCRGHDGCATRYCDPFSKRCGCPPPSVPSSSGKACERIISRQIVPAINCGTTGCRCPDGAKPTADGIGCLLEIKDKPIVLPQQREPDPCFNQERDQDETDSDCGGANARKRRCGSGQRCKRTRDWAANLQCVKVIMSRGANGTVTAEGRCSCPAGRYILQGRTTELCTSAGAVQQCTDGSCQRGRH